MNLCKSIKITILASFAMTSVMPTVVVAAPRQSQRAQSNTKKVAKKSFWTRITNDWESIALGGCALVGIIALVWTLNNKSANHTSPSVKPGAKPKTGVAVWEAGADADDCPICTDPANGHASCCKAAICRACWNTPTKGGDNVVQNGEFAGVVLEEGKVLEKQLCPFCNQQKR